MLHFLTWKTLRTIWIIIPTSNPMPTPLRWKQWTAAFAPSPSLGLTKHTGHDGDPRLVRCGHLFHKTCILQWVDGINPNRNRCPNCRDPLCKLNLLDPDKEAQWQAEEYARTYIPAKFSVGIYSNLMELVDIHFSRQRYVYMQRHNEN